MATHDETPANNSDYQQHQQQQQQQESLSISERFDKAVALSETSPETAISQLEQLQHEIAHLALFSSNESLQDISTKALPLLALEHVLAMAYTRVPTPPHQIHHRRTYLRKSMDLWASFLQKLESLRGGGSNHNDNNDDDDPIMTAAEQQEYHMLLDYCSGDDSSASTAQTPLSSLPTPRREDKIARFRAKQQAQQQVEKLRSLRERRARIGISPEEVLDDFDEESLDRSVAMTNLMIAKAEALEEWAQTLRELPMIERMVQAQQEQQQTTERHQGKQSGNNTHTTTSMQDARQRPPAPSTGLQVTHITLESASGQLQFRKEEIKSQVFRPGWNQPTMSLEEFADRERENAIAREQKQNQAEANRAQGPRRYEQLARDGMEDNNDAVDASAAVDRAWDDWKDENPRGSGNKRGDQGDRNF